MKILLSDDSQFMRTVLQGILEGAYSDAEFLEAGDGEEAIKLFNEHKPDLMLLDLIMPSKGGIDVLKEIDAKSANVIVISAMGQDKIIAEAKELGAKDFVVKPFEDEKVLSTVKAIL